MIVAAALPAMPMITTLGSRMSGAATFATSADIVAEKSSVCRSVGSAATMRWTSGQKPMSSMRSASSSTSTSSASKLVTAQRM